MHHRGLGQPHLGLRQRERPAAVAAARPRGGEPGQGAFAGQLPLELGQRREDAEYEAAGGGGGVDLRALPVSTRRPTPRVDRSCTVLTR